MEEEVTDRNTAIELFEAELNEAILRLNNRGIQVVWYRKYFNIEENPSENTVHDLEQFKPEVTLKYK